jgi:uncharacterized protein with PQ loop repeat
MIAEVSGGLASALSAVFAWPQALRALRASDTAGVSLATTALTWQSGLVWTGYGLLVASGYIVAANVSVGLAALVTLVACRARIPRAPLLLLLAGPALLAATLAWLGPGPAGLLGVAVGGAMTLPQAWTALRGTASLAAVSPTTYALLAVNAACWMVHGVAVDDPLVIAPNCVSLPASLLILWRTARERRATR